MMSDFRYFPIVRTRAAELNGFAEVSDRLKEKMFPIFEITRSRRSKNNPTAAVNKSIERILELQDGKAFGVDLTSLESQMNAEFDDLLDSASSFLNWTNFVAKNFNSNVWPVVHLTDPFDSVDFLGQLNALLATQDGVILRIPTFYEEIDDLVRSLYGKFPAQRVLIMIDAGFIALGSFSSAEAACDNFIRQLKVLSPTFIVTAASSFPSSVAGKVYGDGVEGEIQLTEVLLSQSLAKRWDSKVDIRHGDYASIHPIDYNGVVMNWIPRVDIVLNEMIYFYRERRGDGGYVSAAQRALPKLKANFLKCWGADKVVDAAGGTPEGRSPSFWISVRVNLYLTRQIYRVYRIP